MEPLLCSGTLPLEVFDGVVGDALALHVERRADLADGAVLLSVGRDATTRRDGRLAAIVAARADGQLRMRDGQLSGVEDPGLREDAEQPFHGVFEVVEDRDIAGMNTRVRSVEVINPPMSTTAADLRSSDPSSMPRPSGASATTTDIVVMTMGRKRVGPASTSASVRVLPSRRSVSV